MGSNQVVPAYDSYILGICFICAGTRKLKWNLVKEVLGVMWVRCGEHIFPLFVHLSPNHFNEEGRQRGKKWEKLSWEGKESGCGERSWDFSISVSVQGESNCLQVALKGALTVCNLRAKCLGLFSAQTKELNSSQSFATTPRAKDCQEWRCGLFLLGTYNVCGEGQLKDPASTTYF